MLPTMSVYRRGERNAEPQGEPCLSCTVHLSPAEEGFEFHWDPRASTPTQASETKNVKDKLRPAPGEFSGFHRFLILVCGPVLESSAHLHPSKQLDISVNFPHILRGPPKRQTSLRIFVICHFSFGDQPTPRRPPAVPWGTTFVCAVHLRALQTAIEAL